MRKKPSVYQSENCRRGLKAANGRIGLCISEIWRRATRVAVNVFRVKEKRWGNNPKQSGTAYYYASVPKGTEALFFGGMRLVWIA